MSSALIKAVLELLGAVGVLLIGMHLMSEGIERSADKGMRKIFNKISSNRFAGVGVGAGVTAIIQSSGATTVMVVGFVNAGLMTLFQATAIIMGANIGTTVTALIVSLQALPIIAAASTLAVIGVFMMMLSKKSNIRNIGTMLAGLGTIFVALTAMSRAMNVAELKNVLTDIFKSVDFPLLLIVIGLVATVVMQSSSAITSIIVTLVGTGALGMQSAMFLVLGSNVGTCFTAMLAAIGANTNAKRASLIHLLFNLFGTIFFTVIIWIFGVHVVKFLNAIISIPEMQIAFFHLFFNIITMLLLVGFIKQIVFIAEKIIPDKKAASIDKHLEFIDERILSTPPIAVTQITKEVSRMASLAYENFNTAANAVYETDSGTIELVEKNEKQIDIVNRGISMYLIKISDLSISESDKYVVGSLHNVIADIERIGDHALNLANLAVKMSKENLSFSADALNELKEMQSAVDEHYKMVMQAFEKRDYSIAKKATELEKKVVAYKNALSDNHVSRLKDGKCSVETGGMFQVVLTSFEHVTEHMNNVAYSLKKTGRNNGNNITAKPTKKSKKAAVGGK